MLTKSTNSKYAYLRRVMILPILMVTVCLVSIKVNASGNVEITDVGIQNTTDLFVRDTVKPKKISPPTPPTPLKKISPPTPPTPSNPSLAKPDIQDNMEEVVVVEKKGTNKNLQKNKSK